MFVLTAQRSGRVTLRAVARIVRAIKLRWQFRAVVYSSPWRRRFLWLKAKTLKGQRIVVPTFEIASCPTIKLSDGCVTVEDEEWVGQMTEEELMADLGFNLRI